MTRRPDAGTGINWTMDREQAEELATVLGLLEDFLRQASGEAVAELAGHQFFYVMNPSAWADWLADYLGEQVLALRAATRAVTASTSTSTSTGDPR